MGGGETWTASPRRLPRSNDLIAGNSGRRRRRQQQQSSPIDELNLVKERVTPSMDHHLGHTVEPNSFPICFTDRKGGYRINFFHAILCGFLLTFSLLILRLRVFFSDR